MGYRGQGDEENQISVQSGSDLRKANCSIRTVSSPYHKYDIQQAAIIRMKLLWPLFCLYNMGLGGLEGFFYHNMDSYYPVQVGILIIHNDKAWKRKIYVRIGYMILFILHFTCLNWLYQIEIEYLFNPFAMPPSNITRPLCYVVFVLVVINIVTRQVAMVGNYFCSMDLEKTRYLNYKREAQVLREADYIIILVNTILFLSCDGYRWKLSSALVIEL
ncbi:uncharacterized protein [Rutidosis leptorrhynchoides]|uniref:uncharacterized protein n=1 Tax=Rutidosis leptorrhynchoides TaxID=125765 RepID=UPI003A997768